MSEEWMPLVRLPITIEQFHQLPQNPAYKYEYFNKQAYLTPRPKYCQALLELRPLTEVEPFDIRPVADDDFENLVPMFSAAFHRQQPYGGLSDRERSARARQALEKTFAGGDGPWVRQASFAALEEGHLTGAILITLLPPGDVRDGRHYRWDETPPPDCVERGYGRPHLTWIFVAPFSARHGIGQALLAESVNVLLKLGYKHLLSTFLLGNESSTMWHWRNGFELLENRFSYRAWRRKAAEGVKP